MWKKWTNEEIDFLKKNYKNMTAKEIANKLNRSLYSVKHIRIKLRLKKGPCYRWPKEKVIEVFNNIVKGWKRIPTYDELRNNGYSGMLDAIERNWKTYNNFLISLGFEPNIKTWSKSKCLEEFEKIMKNLECDKAPTLKELNDISPGLRRAIQRRWKSYAEMLQYFNLKPNFERKWDKNKCILEFKKVLKSYDEIPTVEVLKEENADLVAAIYKYYRSYNQLLLDLNLQVKQESWDKEKCITRFKNIMSNRKTVPIFDELYIIDSKLLGAIYRYFGSYNIFLQHLGYEANYGYLDGKWIEWENFVIECCKNIYGKHTKIKKCLKNRKIPDIVIEYDGTITKIIDAKLSIFCRSIDEDIKNYLPYCKKLEFWCLKGNKKSQKCNVKYINIDDIKNLIIKSGKSELIYKLDKWVEK
ncbi:MAG: hypothetical protein KAT37_02755 [Candidatus Aenigmarchaeota archaeon]|nr:hypothetical protein [Candidatus Aenigmarchaeota archaeon]